jgi:uncharacterized protein YecE (DUF72 family)
LAAEFRHPGWFRPAAQDRLAASLEHHGVTWILSDVAARRDALHLRVTSQDVMIRFAGHLLHPTDFTRLDAWAERLDHWLRHGVRRVFFFLHQPREDLVVDLARHLGARLADLGHRCAVPTILPQEHQGTLFS